MVFTQMGMFLEELENTKMVHHAAIHGYTLYLKNTCVYFCNTQHNTLSPL